MKIITLSFFSVLFILTVVIPIAGCQNSLPLSGSSSSATFSAAQLPVTAKECFTQGIELKNNQQFSQALASFTEAIKLDPGFSDSYFEKSKLLSRSSNWEGVIANCSRAINLNPSILEAYYVRGLAQTAMKNYDAALVDLNNAVGMSPSKAEMAELKNITALLVPPGGLLLLNMNVSCAGGKDCRGNYMPYNNTLQLQMLVNPGNSPIEVNKIYLYPAIEGKAELNSPVRYFDTLGLQYLVACLSSENPPSSVPSIKIGFKAKNDLVFKTSNEISTSEITFEPSELICPAN